MVSILALTVAAVNSVKAYACPSQRRKTTFGTSLLFAKVRYSLAVLQRLHITMQSRPYLRPFRTAAVSSHLALLYSLNEVAFSFRWSLEIQTNSKSPLNLFVYYGIVSAFPYTRFVNRKITFGPMYSQVQRNREFPRLGSLFDIHYCMKHR